jgi:hypothetical protein
VVDDSILVSNNYARPRKCVIVKEK